MVLGKFLTTRKILEWKCSISNPHGFQKTRLGFAQAGFLF